jgi:hypothetical protein
LVQIAPEGRGTDPLANQIRRIKKNCESALGELCPDILVSGAFNLDFEQGIIGQTLALFR